MPTIFMKQRGLCVAVCSPDQDQELQQVFNLMVSKGINLFDTADSYGTGDLNGRSEQV
jgi:pyridoxine 4-dehydrogenase